MTSLRKLAVLLVVSLTCALVPATSSVQASDVTLDEAADAVVEHLRAEPARSGVRAADLSDLRVTDAYVSRHTGVRHVYLRQRHRGLDVLGGELTAGVTRAGDVFHVASRFVAGLRSASGRARLDAPAAVAAAASDLGLTAAGPLRVLRRSDGRDRRTVLSAPGVSTTPVTARLVWQATDGAVRLAWNFEIDEPSREHWWNVSVDAEDGSLLVVDDYVDHEDDPETDGAAYRVYPSPFESPNDGPRELVVDPADPDASPYGWHDLDGVAGPDTTITRGNNVFAYADWTGTNLGATPSTHRPVNELLAADGGSDLLFDFPLDTRDYPQEYRDAAVTNLFFWNNVIHDTLHGYGFDEAAGNFQETNYTGTGVGGDAVHAEAQDHGGANNANFATPPDGSNGRMQMYLWPQGRTIRDGSLDAGVVIHEYGHGVSNRLTGGPSDTSCLRNDEQGGEGWSDFLAIALTPLPTDTPDGRRGLGTYVTGESSRYGNGIRPQPYSTHFSVNSSTYDSIRTAAVPHGVGWVWATMLWQMYWVLVAKHGFAADPASHWSAGGNTLAIQLVIDGMKLQPCRPGFVDARDAIIAADQALTGGANWCSVWLAFARRGLGVSADQGSSDNVADGTQAFDVPSGC